MGDELRLLAALGAPLIAAFLATPLAIRVAQRTAFYDHPVGYKRHGRPTPYLGGAAVCGAFLVVALAVGGGVGRFAPIVVGAAVLWVVGTVDDRRTLRPSYRVLVTSALATGLWAGGLGWPVFESAFANLLLTNLWVVGLVNAFNLMDNMDGAAGSVTAVCALGGGAVALTDGHVVLAALMFALGSACLGFLPYNLSSPARIFLGDGGSMPIGFVLAAATMALPTANTLGLPAVLLAALIVALPILDVTLVVVSRRRRGLSVMTGGRDHLTHRLRSRVGSARAVALRLGAAQAALCGVAVLVAELGAAQVTLVSGGVFIFGLGAIAVLERPEWLPAKPQSQPG